MTQKKRVFLYLSFHLALAAGVCLLVLLHRASSLVDKGLVFCFFHDVLHLYCPLCGGTRVLLSLLMLDIPRAFAANPLVLLLIVTFLFLDIRTLIRIARGDAHPMRMHPSVIMYALAAFFLYGVVRNVLLVVFHFDPLGDLLPYYQ